MKTKNPILVSCFVFLAILISNENLFAWGPGHDTLARAVALRLPEPWKSRLQDSKTLRQFIIDNHYPDSFEPFDAQRIGEKGMRYLEEMKMKNRYSLHWDSGRAVAFSLMVEAMRDNEPDRVLLWFSSLLHSAADMPACNHDPLIHGITYLWGPEGWKIDMPLTKEGCVDLAWVEKYDWAKQMFEDRIDAKLIKDDEADLDETLLRIMLYGFEGTDAGSPYNRTIVEDGTRWATENDRPAGERLADALSELGAWAAVRALRDFDVALRLSKGDDSVRYRSDLMTEFNRRADQMLRELPIDNDLIAKEYHSGESAKKPYIGVLYEPIWRMDGGCFGFNDRLQAMQTVGSLRESGYSATLYDIREFQKKGITDPKEVPVLIVSCQRFISYQIMKPDLIIPQWKDYLARGGKIIWIGSIKPPKELTPALHSVLKATKDSGFPLPWEDFLKQKLVFVSENDKTTEWNFLKIVTGQQSWGWPRNPHFLPKEIPDEIQPILKLTGPSGKIAVGAAFPQKKPNFVYLPNYAIFPYLLTDETPELAPIRLKMDQVGTFILNESLHRLSVDKARFTP